MMAIKYYIKPKSTSLLMINLNLLYVLQYSCVNLPKVETAALLNSQTVNNLSSPNKLHSKFCMIANVFMKAKGNDHTFPQTNDCWLMQKKMGYKFLAATIFILIQYVCVPPCIRM